MTGDPMPARTRKLVIAVVLAATVISQAARAEPEAPAAALEHFRDALKLKDAGSCEQAIPLFQESARLDKQAKTLIQLADCEETVGRWSDALRDWRDARDQASLGSDPVSARQREVAERRMRELDARLPRLTVVLAPESAKDVRVTRDGVRLGPVSLNRPLPVDPGRHVVEVAARDHVSRTWTVTLVEGEQRELHVLLDKRLEPPHAAPRTRAPAPPRTRPSVAAPRNGTQRTVGLTLGGAGLLGGAAAGALWLSALAKHEDARDACTPDCGAEARARQNDATEQVELARILGAAGAAVFGAGVVLFATAKEPSAPGLSVAVSPPVGSIEPRLQVSAPW
jgi:hypothetical protein